MTQQATQHILLEIACAAGRLSVIFSLLHCGRSVCAVAFGSYAESDSDAEQTISASSPVMDFN